MMNPISLCQRLIQFPSITPRDEGIITYLVSVLESIGFICHLLPQLNANGQTIQNLYARKGKVSPNLCFAGHVDVVPVGQETFWSQLPFGGHIDKDVIWGRGAVDMKGAIAAFISAVTQSNPTGSISLLLTGDEEGEATHGTQKVIEWLETKNEIIDFCIVGEPTCDNMLGDTIKIGRRGSLNGTLTVKGTQGHVAYPHKADNPIPKMLQLLDTLNACVLDDGYPGFQPSHLEITSIDVGNLATNIIPAGITANFNVRFNPSYTQQSLKQHLQKTLHTTHIDHSLEFAEGAEPFIIKEHPGMRIMKQAVHETTKIPSEYSTSGGTSDARFIQKIAPVIEFGLLNNLAHKIDEHVSIKDLEMLTEIYKRFIALYFKTIF